MEDQDEFIVIKAGNEKNILDLYENGTIHCNTHVILVQEKVIA